MRCSPRCSSQGIQSAAGGRSRLGGVARVAGQDEVPDLVQVTVLPLPGHQHPLEHAVDGHPAGSDVGEWGAAVGAASVSIAAQRNALAAGPLVDEEAGLGGLAAAADVEGVDDVSKAEPDGGSVSCGLQVAAVAGPAGV
jgi:hypothetical protein